jgi:hypothetical protein
MFSFYDPKFEVLMSPATGAVLSAGEWKLVVSGVSCGQFELWRTVRITLLRRRVKRGSKAGRSYQESRRKRPRKQRP